MDRGGFVSSDQSKTGSNWVCTAWVECHVQSGWVLQDLWCREDNVNAFVHRIPRRY